ncbi:PucR family transcriptional regulator [Lentzea sp. JNUCC 0626]|uniref:PucR family transcriptional regulator n=1 Tax=Lentzea sp. JNUCC 0626 TaxID=3367513 RepID=UPI003748D088
MFPSEAQDLIDEIADRLGTGVSLDDLTGRLVAYSTQHGGADDARVRALLQRRAPADVRDWEDRHGAWRAASPMLIPANAALGMNARVCVPLISRGVRVGLLFVLVPDKADDAGEIALAGVGVISDQVEVLSALLYESASPHLDERRARENDFTAAYQGDTAAQERVQQHIKVRGAQRLHLAVSMFATSGGRTWTQSAQVRVAAQQVVARLPGVLAGVVHDTHVVLLLRADRDTDPGSIAHTWLTEAITGQRTQDEEHLATGVSTGISAAEALPSHYRRAAVAAQVAVVEPELGPVTRWDDIGPYRIIAPGDHDFGDSPMLEAIRAQDSTGALARTLETIYDSPGTIQEVADLLHLHRTSLYYRIGKIREIIGSDPLVGAARLELHLSLKLRRWSTRPQI